MDEHQVSGEEGWIEHSFGIAVLAYLLLIRACYQEILPGTSWSIAQLQHAFRIRIITTIVSQEFSRVHQGCPWAAPVHISMWSKGS